jgi:hypothetical protein
MDAAQAAGGRYAQESPEEVLKETDSIRKNVIYANARAKVGRDGKSIPAVLDPYIAKDRNGDPLDPLQFCLPPISDSWSIGLGSEEATDGVEF